MLGNFNIPSVDHLREGIDYRVVDWDFAAQAPATSGAAEGQRPTSGQGCQEGFKPVFGVCRKVKEGGAEKDWDTNQKSDQEKQLEGEAKKSGSDAKTNKAFESGGKKFGWAIKNGKPVVVEWGSVAGTKAKPNPPAAAPAGGAGATPSAAGAGAQAIGAAGAQAAGGPPKPGTPASGAEVIGKAAAR